MSSVNQAPVEPEAQKRKIYSYMSVGLATFFGGPVAAAYLLSKNYRAFNLPNAAIVTWVIAVIAEIGIIAAFVAAPGVADLSFIIPLAYTAIVLLLTYVLQGRQMATYYSNGGEAFAYSWGIGIGLLILGITLVILFIAVIILLVTSGVSC